MFDILLLAVVSKLNEFEVTLKPKPRGTASLLSNQLFHEIEE